MLCLMFDTPQHQYLRFVIVHVEPQQTMTVQNKYLLVLYSVVPQQTLSDRIQNTKKRIYPVLYFVFCLPTRNDLRVGTENRCKGENFTRVCVCKRSQSTQHLSALKSDTYVQYTVQYSRVRVQTAQIEIEIEIEYRVRNIQFAASCIQHRRVSYCYFNIISADSTDIAENKSKNHVQRQSH